MIRSNVDCMRVNAEPSRGNLGHRPVHATDVVLVVGDVALDYRTGSIIDLGVVSLLGGSC